MIPAIYLISCTKKKMDDSCAASEMYMPSPKFKKSKEIAEKQGAPYFILSAKHHLLRPECVIDWYEQKVAKAHTDANRKWAERTVAEMKTTLPKAEKVIMLAPKNYYAGLLGWLGDNFPSVETPFKGLAMGKQLQWLGKELERLRNESC